MGKLLDSDVVVSYLQGRRHEAYIIGDADGVRLFNELIGKVIEVPEAVVLCKQCYCYGLCSIAEAGGFGDNGYCSRGERREDEAD